MADDRPEDTELPPDLGRAKRAPPTIELEASEVSDKPASEETGGEPATATGDAPAPEGTDEADEAAADPIAERADAAAGIGVGETAGAPPAGPEPRKARRAPVLVPAIAGAGGAGLVLAMAWLLGPQAELPASAPVAPVERTAFEGLAARVARMEAKAPAPAAAPDAAATSRIEALEATLASLRSELATARSRSERLSAVVDELKAAPRDAAAPDLSAINERLAQIERTTSAQIAASAQKNAKPADDSALRRVVAATLLDVSVRHGEPFAGALDTAKALAPDPGVLKPLDSFAASGVPSPAGLSRDLLALLPKPAPAAETTATSGTGIVDRLQAGAARLVRIQRTDSADTIDRSGAIMRAASAAQRNDLAGARRELNALPPADRAAVQPGLDRLDARDAALAASRQFAADAMAALSKPAP